MRNNIRFMNSWCFFIDFEWNMKHSISINFECFDTFSLTNKGMFCKQPISSYTPIFHVRGCFVTKLRFWILTIETGKLQNEMRTEKWFCNPHKIAKSMCRCQYTHTLIVVRAIIFWVFTVDFSLVFIQCNSVGRRKHRDK